MTAYFLLTVLVVLAACRRATARLRARERTLAVFREAVDRAVHATLAGALDLRPALRADAPELCELAEAARRRGWSTAVSLAALRRQAERAALLLSEGRRLQQLFCGRALVAVGFAALGRMYFEFAAPAALVSATRLQDAAAVVLSGVLLTVVQLVYARHLPTSWLWDGRLTRVAHAWITVHVSDVLREGAPAYTILRELSLREIKTGVSLRASRRRVLTAWGREESREDRQRLRRCEDLLPLAELLGIGLPAALLLLVPGLVFVKNVG